MCVAVTCPRCKKPDWKGCGAHVEQVLGHVPPAERCKCREQPQDKTKAAEATKAGFLSRLFK